MLSYQKFGEVHMPELVQTPLPHTSIISNIDVTLRRCCGNLSKHRIIRSAARYRGAFYDPEGCSSENLKK
jgi:hypothetical protein